MAFDYKKEYREFYMPKNVPSIVDVPPMNYIAVRGRGDPNDEGGEYKDAMGKLFEHFSMELGQFENMIIKDDWCAIRYTVKIRNLDTGEEILQNTMEFVKFKENPEPIGVRVVEGWALSDISLAAL